ncbi:MAG: CPBP family intramembrane glutamic endopeptidase [Nitrososphaerota archaeon]
MQQSSPLVIVTNLTWLAVWVATALLIALFGQRAARLAAFRARMLAQWPPALVFAVLTLIGLVAADISTGADMPGALLGDLFLPVAVFAQALLGLAIARGIPRYEPLPLVDALARRKHVLRTFGLALISIIVAVPLGILLGSVGTSLGAGLTHETVRSSALSSQFPSNPAVAFLLLLAGAGIAEEVVYRLVILSLVWRLTGHAWIAILVAALLHALYHLTPLDSFYLQFWQYPVAQVMGTVFISAIWGVLYVKRGFESAVLGHTLADWVSVTFLLH